MVGLYWQYEIKPLLMRLCNLLLGYHAVLKGHNTFELGFSKNYYFWGDRLTTGKSEIVKLLNGRYALIKENNNGKP